VVGVVGVVGVVEEVCPNSEGVRTLSVNVAPALVTAVWINKHGSSPENDVGVGLAFT
jgi:hypothetical protein